MGRSLKKGVFIEKKLFDKVLAARAAKKHDVIKTWSRRSTVVPEMVGLTLAVHNGKKFIPVFISENMIGCKLGEFSLTRTYKGHTSKDKKVKAKP
jgi:small subunit ribosomal protein S19